MRGISRKAQGSPFASREGKGDVRDGNWTGNESHVHEIEKV